MESAQTGDEQVGGSMPETTTLRDLFIEELQDILHGERQPA